MRTQRNFVLSTTRTAVLIGVVALLILVLLPAALAASAAGS
jgi:hypothetical protein